MVSVTNCPDEHAGSGRQLPLTSTDGTAAAQSDACAVTPRLVALEQVWCQQ